jgi:hypothetical protein
VEHDQEGVIVKASRDTFGTSNIER